MDNSSLPYAGNHPTDLSPPAPREELHNRRIKCDGFLREDGLYDIEAEITDNKTYNFPNDFRGDVTPEMFVHRMKVRVTINDKMEVIAAEAVTLAGPYAICPTANDVFESLVGLTIGPGWRRKVAAAIGGRHGCTHITELMGSVGTIAYQTRFGEQARARRSRLGDKDAATSRKQDAAANAAKSAATSFLANSCVAYATED